MTKKSRDEIRYMFGGRCAYCGKTLGDKFHTDHVDPLCRHIAGHKERDKNALLYPACGRCNLWKATYTVEQFRREIGMQIERLRRDSAPFRLAEDFGSVVEVAIPVRFYFEKFDPNTEKPF
jgi:hypothetical protein